jgi:hypothetical protein
LISAKDSKSTTFKFLKTTYDIVNRKSRRNKSIDILDSDKIHNLNPKEFPNKDPACVLLIIAKASEELLNQ